MCPNLLQTIIKSAHWTNQQVKFWLGQNFNYRHIVVEIVEYNGEVYYIAIVFCLSFIGICLKIIPKETFQRSYGSLSPFFRKSLFSTMHQQQGRQLLCSIMPSKILHNLRSVAIVNLLSRFCNPSFNYSFFTFL